MPNIKSAKKRLKQTAVRKAENLPAKTRVKTSRRKLFESFAEGNIETATADFRMYCSVMDKAVKQGIIKKNTAIRRKTRSAKLLRALPSN